MSLLIKDIKMSESGTTITGTTITGTTGTIKIPNTVITAASHYPTWTVGIARSVPELFICPYCDCYSKEPGICKNCGGVKEIAK